MPAIGYTTVATGSQVFTHEEMLDLLSSTDNPTDFTPAMFHLLNAGYRGDGVVTPTTLVSACPREVWLKSNRDYTVPLEQGFRAMDAVFSELAASTPAQPGATRKHHFGRFIPTTDGRRVWLPFTVHELIDHYPSNRVTMREYFVARTLPNFGKPFPIHDRLLNLHRLLLSDTPIGNEPPILWEWADYTESLRPFDPDKPTRGYLEAEQTWDIWQAEAVYRAPDAARRVVIGQGTKSAWANLNNLAAWLVDRMGTYTGKSPVGYLDAIDPSVFDFQWKCSFCPVARQCRHEYAVYEFQLSKEELYRRAQKENLLPSDPSDF